MATSPNNPLQSLLDVLTREAREYVEQKMTEAGEKAIQEIPAKFLRRINYMASLEPHADRVVIQLTLARAPEEKKS